MNTDDLGALVILFSVDMESAGYTHHLKAEFSLVAMHHQLLLKLLTCAITLATRPPFWMLAETSIALHQHHNVLILSAYVCTLLVVWKHCLETPLRAAPQQRQQVSP
jgi:hypothetical protein